MLDIQNAAVITLPMFSLQNPVSVVVTNDGTLYVADDNCIKSINTAGVVSSLAGSDEAGSTETNVFSELRYNQPSGMAVDRDQKLYIADTLNSAIRVIVPSNQTAYTFAGTRGVSGAADGPVLDATFNKPRGIAFDTNTGGFFVADTLNHCIRQIDGQYQPNVTTYAGKSETSGSVDGTAPDARFNQPHGVAVDSLGVVFVSDTLNHCIRRISTDGNVTTFAGALGDSGSADGTGSTARFNQPESIAIDSDGNIYVADRGNHLIRRIDSQGVVTTVAGMAGVSGSTNGTVTAARFNNPQGIAVDAEGKVYVADRDNRLVRVIASDLIQITGITGITINNKVYDGTTTAPIGSLNLDNLVYAGMESSDILDISSATITFASASVGNGKTVTLSNIVFGGNSRSYIPPTSIQLSGNITQKQLTGITGITVNSKVYDGTTTAPFGSLNLANAVFQGKIETDVLSITSATVTFASASVGNKVVTLTDIVLEGANQSSYLLPSSVEVTGNITPKQLTGITGITVSKVYDGTTTAPFGSLNLADAVFQGKLETDVLSITSATVTFASASVGDNKVVTLTDIVLEGANQSSYLLPSSVEVTGNITPKQLTGITGITVSKVYDGTTTAPFGSLNLANAVFQGKLETDVLSITSATVTFASSSAGDNKVVTLSNIVLGGANQSSYLLPSIVQLSGNITPKQITDITGITVSKVYDGITTAPFGSLNLANAVFQGKLETDVLSITSATVTFASSSAGVNKIVTLTDIVLGGANQSSYLPPSSVQLSGNITQKQLIGITGITVSKVYDGTTTAPFGSLNLDNAVFQGKLETDVLSITSATVTFASASVGDNKVVTLSNIVLGGANQSSYLPPSSVQITGNITPKQLISITGITGITVNNKVYDGTTTAPFGSLNLANAVFQGKTAGDVLSITSATVTFASASVGNNKVVTLSNIVLGGANQSSYQPPSSVQITGNITPKQLTGITGITVSKVYDGTTTAPFGSLKLTNPVFQGKLAADVLSITSATVTFASASVGNKVVTLSKIVLGGANQSSYLPPPSVQLSGNITPKQLTGITGITVNNKVYDGKPIAPFGSLKLTKPVFQGKLAADVLSITSATVTFASASVGNNKVVTLSKIVLGGASRLSYLPPPSLQIRGNIVASKPSVPLKISINTSKITASTVVFTWAAPASNGGSNISGYSVLVKKQGVLLSPQPKVVVNGTSATITGLTNNTTYTFAVAAKNTSGIGAYSAFIQAKTLFLTNIKF